MFPYRRFDCILADAAARLGADVDRYSLHRGGLSPLTPRRFYPGAPYFLPFLTMGPMQEAGMGAGYRYPPPALSSLLHGSIKACSVSS